jgi:hypothetical protein
VATVPRTLLHRGSLTPLEREADSGVLAFARVGQAFPSFAFQHFNSLVFD